MRVVSLLFLLLITCGCAPQMAYEPEEVVIRPIPTPIQIEKEPLLVRPTLPPANRPLIVIDPGHGGEDFGTQSNSKPRYQEKHLNLATARLLKTYLNQMGFATVMTRSKDVFIALDKRAEFAND